MFFSSVGFNAKCTIWSKLYDELYKAQDMKHQRYSFGYIVTASKSQLGRWNTGFATNVIYFHEYFGVRGIVKQSKAVTFIVLPAIDNVSF